MVRILSVLKDPLTHFLAFGLAFFILAGGFEPSREAPAGRIVVDRAALLDFIQYRSKAFEPETAAALLDAMTDDQRARLIEDFVEEEVLYREAKALGLETGDYVIKQRMIQKLDFMTEAAVGGAAPDEDAVAAYYEARKADYAIPPAATFAHVFFSAETRGMEEARNEAGRMAARLNRMQAPFEGAVGHGDRFPFHVNYVERTYDYVASQFGDDAASAIFDKEGPFERWRGPLVSQYGAHAVFVRAVTEARTPALDEVRSRVAEDAARAARAEAKADIVAEAASRYDVVIDLDAPDGAASAGILARQ